MSPVTAEVVRLIREARLAVADARERARLFRACELLKGRDADGNPTDALPYTEAALRELRAAHAHDPDDIRTLHHLAVAQHARAWDLEIAGRPEAAEAWTEALGSWRDVAASGPFWAALEAKLRRCDPEADVAGIAAARRDLLENLLDVHVDFVRHYCENGAPDQAARHVAVIHTARVPPALRRRLVGKVFEAMTGGLPEAKARAAFRPALTTVERFLELFPVYLPALRLHTELCTAWASSLSYKDDWPAIEEVSSRAAPFADQLGNHADLEGDGDEGHLAKAALHGLAAELVERGYDRTHAYLGDRDYDTLGATERVELSAGLELAVRWGRLARKCSPSGSRVRTLYTLCLSNRAVFLHREAEEVRRADIDASTKAAARARLYRQATAEIEEALTWGDTDVEERTRRLGNYKQVLERCERELAADPWATEESEK